MKFAFIIMGDFNPEVDRTSIHNGAVEMVGVASVLEACKVAEELVGNGINCIELCGAFGKEGTKEVIKATHNQVPVGYVTHLSMQDDLYQSVFGK